MEIIALCRDRNGFEREIKLDRPLPILDFIDWKPIEAKIRFDMSKTSEEITDKRIRFYRSYQIGENKFLYTQE